MSRRRWWQQRPDLFEHEKRELAGLGFSLEQEQLERDGDVVFTGRLRRGSRRHRAQVIYPPAFVHGAQVQVRAPGLPIGRHIDPDGMLCLDHPVAGQLESLGGAEAVRLAERLWELWEEDRDALTAAEARAPEPHSHYTAYYPGSAIVLADVDVTGGRCGVLRVGLTGATPYRGAVTGLRIDNPDRGELEVSPVNATFAGPVVALGLWRRLEAPPPGYRIDHLAAWAERDHADLLAKADDIAVAHRRVTRRTAVPALVAFVYPDELEWQGYGDQWMLMFTDPAGSRQLARAVTLRAGDRFTRQPLLEPLADKSVAIIGLGALGSTIAALLARAGVGKFVLVDIDYLTAGNVVRHDLDLGDVGAEKVAAVRARLQRINPYVEIVGMRARYGHASQADDDQVFEALAGCDLIVNAAANPAGVHEHIAAAGREAERPVVHTWITAGGWGARVIAQTEASGCPECLARHQAVDEEAYPVQEGPTAEVLERGCSDPTFTAAGFDLSAAASAAARAVVGTLVDDPGRYPPPPDLLTLTMRTAEHAVHTSCAEELPIHPECWVCGG